MIERLPRERPMARFYDTVASAGLRRVSDEVFGMPRLEETTPDDGFTSAQLEEIAALTARTDAARARAERDIASGRSMGGDRIRSIS